MTITCATTHSNHRTMHYRCNIALLLLCLPRCETFCPLPPGGSGGTSRIAAVVTESLRPRELFYRNGLYHNSPLSKDATLDPMTEIQENESPIAPLAIPPRVRRKYDTFQWLLRNNTGDGQDDSSYNINYRVEGPVNGPPVLLIHGFGGSVGHFRHQFPALTEAGFRVYAIDLLGFGSSDKPGDVPYSIELFTELLKDFMLAMDQEITSSNIGSSLPKKKWVVAGNSIGGLCSLAVAELLPDLIRGVVLFNCSGGMSVFRDEYVPFIFRPILYFFKNVVLGPRVGRYFFSNFKTRRNVESVLKLQGVYRNAARVDDELLETLLEPGNDEGAEAVFLKVFGGPPGPTPESILPKVECPILAIWGGADPWLPVDRGMHPGTEFHRYVRDEGNFDLVVLPNVGHCPHDEAYEEANRHMIPWLESLPLVVDDEADI